LALVVDAADTVMQPGNLGSYVIQFTYSESLFVVDLGGLQFVEASEQQTSGLARLVSLLPEVFVRATVAPLDVGQAAAVVVQQRGQLHLGQLSGAAAGCQAFAQLAALPCDELRFACHVAGTSCLRVAWAASMQHNRWSLLVWQPSTRV
jgi:hypothetical protein